MIESNAHKYGKMQREMLRQKLPLMPLPPIRGYGLVVESNPSPQNYIHSLIEGLADKMVHAPGGGILKTWMNGDEIKTRQIPLGKFYITSDSHPKSDVDNDDWKISKENGEVNQEDTRLKFVNGVYE
jgi:hypothetical protein